MRDAIFLGTSKADLRGFPDEARREAGVELHQVQLGLDPSHWKPMPGIGPGVREIRIHAGGAFRVIYLAARTEGSTCCTVSRRRPKKRRRAILNWRGSVSSKLEDRP